MKKADWKQAVLEALLTALGMAAGVAMLGGAWPRGSGPVNRLRAREEGASQAGALFHALRSYVAAEPGPLPFKSLPGDACGGCWALEAGRHDVTARLPGWFRAAPYNATMAYKVRLAPQGMPSVYVDIRWEDAKP